MNKYQIKVKHVKASIRSGYSVTSDFMQENTCAMALAAKEHLNAKEVYAGTTHVRYYMEGGDSMHRIVHQRANPSDYIPEYGFLQYSKDRNFVEANPDADPEQVLHEFEYEIAY